MDNLLQFAAVPPTRCSFCQMDDAFLDHIFFLCPTVHLLCSYFGALLSVTPLTTCHWRSCLLTVWTGTPNHFLGDVQIIFTGVLLWNIWKMYTFIIFDDAQWSPRTVIHLVREDIFLSTKSRSRTKKVANISSLIQVGLSPPLTTCQLRIVGWLLPPVGRLKLNTDAALGQHTAGGGAILRDATGAFMHAIFFPLRLDFPLRTESQALYLALIY